MNYVYLGAGILVLAIICGFILLMCKGQSMIFCSSKTLVNHGQTKNTGLDMAADVVKVAESAAERANNASAHNVANSSVEINVAPATDGATSTSRGEA